MRIKFICGWLASVVMVTAVGLASPAASDQPDEIGGRCVQIIFNSPQSKRADCKNFGKTYTDDECKAWRRDNAARTGNTNNRIQCDETGLTTNEIKQMYSSAAKRLIGGEQKQTLINMTWDEFYSALRRGQLVAEIKKKASKKFDKFKNIKCNNTYPPCRDFKNSAIAMAILSGNEEAIEYAANEEAAAAKAKVEAENAAAYKAAEAFIAKMDAENAAYKAKEKADEAVKKKAAEDEAAEKQAAIDDAFSVFDITAKEAAAKKKAAEEEAAKKEIEEKQRIQSRITNELLRELLLEKFGDLIFQYPELEYAIFEMEIAFPANLTQMKTINSQGIKRTMYCNPKCTVGSPLLQSNRTGIDMGIPLVIYDAISEAINKAFRRDENPLNKSDMKKLITSIYKEMAKTIDDPNINKAMAMPAEQLKQIEVQQKKTQAGSKDNSGGSTTGGSAEGHDHHHEEEDPGTAPGDPGDHYSSGIGG
ncbi:hypothetical protein N9401_06850 [Amylibacter sp.]|nr:hypothetical protein [Amylibacter sp.]